MINNPETKKSYSNDKSTDANRQQTQENQPTQAMTDTLRTEIKKTWSKLSDEDVKLYDRQPDLFFKRIKEKHDLNQEDAQKKLDQIKQSCGCGTSKAVA